MGGAYSNYVGEEKHMQGFGGGSCGQEGDAGVDGRIILRWIFRKCGVGVRI